MGGKEGYTKLFRRAGCVATMAIRIIWIQNWLGLLSLPLLFLAFTKGYGESSWLMMKLKNKWLVRLACGLMYSAASVFILWGNWWLFGFHVAVVSLGVMLAGNQKFKFDDQAEEFYIGLLVGSSPILA
jgi:hypothetical protein